MTSTSNDVLFRLAQCFISGYDISKLIVMLNSDDTGVVLDGLFVCKEIGSLVCEVNQSLLLLQSNEDADVKEMANEAISLCELYLRDAR